MEHEDLSRKQVKPLLYSGKKQVMVDRSVKEIKPVLMSDAECLKTIFVGSP